MYGVHHVNDVISHARTPVSHNSHCALNDNWYSAYAPTLRACLEASGVLWWGGYRRKGYIDTFCNCKRGSRSDGWGGSGASAAARAIFKRGAQHRAYYCGWGGVVWMECTGRRLKMWGSTISKDMVCCVWGELNCFQFPPTAAQLWISAHRFFTFETISNILLICYWASGLTCSLVWHLCQVHDHVDYVARPWSIGQCRSFRFQCTVSCGTASFTINIQFQKDAYRQIINTKTSFRIPFKGKNGQPSKEGRIQRYASISWFSDMADNPHLALLNFTISTRQCCVAWSKISSTGITS